jgi:hypothetical protein
MCLSLIVTSIPPPRGAAVSPLWLSFSRPAGSGVFIALIPRAIILQKQEIFQQKLIKVARLPENGLQFFDWHLRIAQRYDVFQVAVAVRKIYSIVIRYFFFILS